MSLYAKSDIHAELKESLGNYVVSASGERGKKFIISVSDMNALLEIPELKHKTFGKILQLIQAILLGNESANLSKKFQINVDVINILRKYIR